MAPDSLGAELVALAAAVLTAVLLSPLWNVAGGRWRLPVRGAALTACLLTATAAGLIWVNHEVDVYPTWGSLVSSDPAEAAAATGPHPASTKTGATTGQMLTTTVAGKASGLTMPVYVYLPPGYGQQPDVHYPVIEALHGYPGSPVQWVHRMNVGKILDREITAGRMSPTVVLFPYQTPSPTIDTECANLDGGPQAETFLTVDLPAEVRADYHVRADPAGWGLIGYSAGGYCATNLLLRHPDRYAAGASLSGDATPGIHIGKGAENTVYNDLWRLTHLPIPAVALYLACATTDRIPVRDMHDLARAAHAPLSVTTAYVGGGGGHNVGTWEAMEAPAFDWLSTSLGRPVVPPPSGEPQPSPVGSPAGGR
ncbi:esterase [Actinoplanes sp. SE50]|uniref:alpha/beta hydrolase n=1 Tax=unclassified Actinoplanes TaxID=2626549 RepID=UPI00023EC7A6|nr:MULTISPECIES: alpha/beta hydrolase-fold protein [unclassified Actinoplanes]AEV84204.1 Endo-1,4-beta-xylanase Z [Actinoplanes sp. SE50/110]ATO82596.1 esterase [Actinoplanes sp. SE50]SLM00003.1 esterase [Actinoplanes sp. SE50/110]